MSNEVFLSLGSNIDPEKNIILALNFLNQHFQITSISHTWLTKSVGIHSNDFLNTAVKFLTDSDADSLKMNCLRYIERNLGRVRVEDKNAPRTIDLDIIIFNQIVIEKNIFCFDYLILPFAEIIPEIIDPKSKLSLLSLSEKISGTTSAKIYGYLKPDN